MTLPASYGTGTVTGTYVNLDGTPAQGNVTFTPRASRIVATSDDVIVVPRKLTVTLDAGGSFTTDLPATDDPDISPTGFTYYVQENLTSGGGSSYDIEVPVGSTQDLSDVLAGTVGSGGSTIVKGEKGDPGGIVSVTGGAGASITGENLDLTGIDTALAALPDLVAGSGIDLTPSGDTLVVSQQGADVQDFSTVGTATWTKPAGATLIMVYVLGGGGGGGAGRKGAEGTLRHGGCGGQAGSAVVMVLPASAVSNTVTVTVGDGGAGAAAQATNSTDGATGTPGSASSFGTYAAANGGSGGYGGDSTGRTTYSAFFHPASQWPAGFSGLNGDYGSGVGPPSAGSGHAGGGGAGGYRSAANANSVFIGVGGLGAGNLTAPSGSGAAGNAGSTIYGGTGGNGGLASGSGNATSGGAGGVPSGGGGGGGAAVNSVGNSGAGGKGGKGFVRVVTLR